MSRNRLSHLLATLWMEINVHNFSLSIRSVPSGSQAMHARTSTWSHYANRNGRKNSALGSTCPSFNQRNIENCFVFKRRRSVSCLRSNFILFLIRSHGVCLFFYSVRGVHFATPAVKVIELYSGSTAECTNFMNYEIIWLLWYASSHFPSRNCCRLHRGIRKPR